jgi:hypothetical protein
MKKNTNGGEGPVKSARKRSSAPQHMRTFTHQKKQGTLLSTLTIKCGYSIIKSMVTITSEAPVSWICPFPYEGTSVHTHCACPCHSAACALHIRHAPFPHPHDDDDGDTVHSASQCRHPSSNPSQTTLLHLTTRRTALVCGRYNKLGTDASQSSVGISQAPSTYFSTSSCPDPHYLPRLRPTPHVGRCADLP